LSVSLNEVLDILFKCGLLEVTVPYMLDFSQCHQNNVKWNILITVTL